MILGFDFLGFQVIKRFPTKNRVFLHVMQYTITKNSFLLMFYSCVLVFYPYVTDVYFVCTRMYLVCTRMYPYVLVCYSYVLVCYSYVLVWCFSHDPICKRQVATSLILTDLLQLNEIAGKIDNLQQVCGVFVCILYAILLPGSISLCEF